jgi:hypothetical protein
MSTFKRYGGAIETAIGLIRTANMDPTAALRKTAESSGLRAPEIEYVAAQINNSRALMHMCKTTGEDRLAAFPLADAAAVIADIKPDSIRKTASTQNPFTVSGAGVRKTAALEFERRFVSDPRKEFGVLMEEARRNKAIELQLHRAYIEDVRKLRNTCSRLVNRIIGSVKKMSEGERHAYVGRCRSHVGSDVVDTVLHCAGVEDDSQPSQAPLPESSIYRDTKALVDTVQKLAAVEDALERVHHVAGTGFFEDFLANSAAISAATKWLPSSVVGEEIGEAAAIREVDNALSDKGLVDMSPDAAARLSGLRTRRTFMDAVLSDPNLRGYPLSRLSRAFNDAVQTDPSIVRSPPRLRAGMMQMLQSSVLDPFQLGQIVDTGKKQQAIYKELKSQRENFNKAVGDYAGGKYGDYITKLEEMAKAGGARAKVNEDYAGKRKEKFEKLLGNIQTHWKELKTSAQKAVDTEDIIKHRLALVDIAMADPDSEIAKDMQTRAIQAGFSDVEAMKRGMIKYARRPDAVLKTDTAAKNAWDSIDQVFEKRGEITGKEQAAAERLAESVIGARLASANMEDDEYTRQARLAVDAELAAMKQQDPTVPGSLTDLATRAMSALDVNATAEFKSRLTDVENRAKALRFADDVQDTVRRAGNRLTDDEKSALIAVDMAMRDNSRPDLGLAAPVADIVRAYEKTSIDLALKEALRPFERLPSTDPMRIQIEGLAASSGIGLPDIVRAIVASKINDDEAAGLVAPRVAYGVTADALTRDAADPNSPTKDASQNMLNLADRVTKDLVDKSPLIFRKLT